VVAPDLPSLGRDGTTSLEISLETWTNTICRILDDQAEPVILVGHSQGGIIISQAAEVLMRPHALRHTVRCD